VRLNEEKPRSATIDLIAYKLPSTLVRPANHDKLEDLVD
jgi:hypothetical protein